MDLVLIKLGAAASSTATTLLGSAIRSSNVYRATAGPAKFGKAYRNTGQATLDFRDFMGPDASIRSGKVDPRTFSLARRCSLPRDHPRALQTN